MTPTEARAVVLRELLELVYCITDGSADGAFNGGELGDRLPDADCALIVEEAKKIAVQLERRYVYTSAVLPRWPLP